MGEPRLAYIRLTYDVRIRAHLMQSSLDEECSTSTHHTRLTIHYAHEQAQVKCLAAYFTTQGCEKEGVRGS